MKCICPKCKYEFSHSLNKEMILEFIKQNPGCSFADIHWDIRMAVKNVVINVRQLEKDGLVKMTKDGGRKTQIYLK
jgi:DNA-binding MarR family transcriptional regulator